MRSDPQRMDYIRPRVLRSVRRRLLSALLLAAVVGGVVALVNPVGAVFLALLSFVLTLSLVVINAYGRHSERWEWWKAGGELGRPDPGNPQTPSNPQTPTTR